MMKKRARLTIDSLSYFLDKLAENSNSVYWLSTPDFKSIEYLSPAYEQIWGRTREELYQHPEKWISYLHPDDCYTQHPIQDMAARIAALGEAAQFSENYRILRPNGETRWIVDRGFPIYDSDGCCHGVTGVAIDITREKEFEVQLRLAKEKAEAANRAKSQFIANMSHDIRTPLTGILGLAQELMELAEEPHTQIINRVQEDGYYLMDAANALLELLNGILETLCLESGKGTATEESFNLEALIAHHVKLMQPLARYKKLRLTYHIEEGVPLIVRGLRHYLDRSLLNLLSNALKFTDQGFVNIQVALCSKQPSSGSQITLNIKIEDSGIGIPSDKFETIFEHFSRLTPSYQGLYKGAGLGLSMVRHYMAAMNATLHLESRVSLGSCFMITLPLTRERS